MAWDNQHPFTRDSFREHVQSMCIETVHGDLTPVIQGRAFPPLWWLNGEIRVFAEAAVPQQTVDLIITAVDERIRETTGLEFRFVDLGDHPSAREPVAQATSARGLDEERLFALSLTEGWRDERRGGRQHGDIYITTKPLLDDSGSWGASRFTHGTMVFALHSGRSSRTGFLRRVALHETNHLLGMRTHCDYHQNVAGLRYAPSCNMHGSCPSETLCLKCRTFIQHWWDQLLYEQQQEQGLASG